MRPKKKVRRNRDGKEMVAVMIWIPREEHDKCLKIAREDFRPVSNWIYLRLQEFLKAELKSEVEEVAK